MSQAQQFCQTLLAFVNIILLDTKLNMDIVKSLLRCAYTSCRHGPLHRQGLHPSPSNTFKMFHLKCEEIQMWFVSENTQDRIKQLFQLVNSIKIKCTSRQLFLLLEYFTSYYVDHHFSECRKDCNRIFCSHLLESSYFVDTIKPILDRLNLNFNLETQRLSVHHQEQKSKSKRIVHKTTQKTTRSLVWSNSTETDAIEPLFAQQPKTEVKSKTSLSDLYTYFTQTTEDVFYAQLLVFITTSVLSPTQVESLVTCFETLTSSKTIKTETKDMTPIKTACFVLDLCDTACVFNQKLVQNFVKTKFNKTQVHSLVQTKNAFCSDSKSVNPKKLKSVIDFLTTEKVKSHIFDWIEINEDKHTMAIAKSFVTLNTAFLKV